MNDNFSKVFIFVAGAAIGSVVTLKFLEEKYKRIADEEIESVKETFKKAIEKEVGEDKNVEETPVKVATVSHTPDKPNITDYAAMTRGMGYDTETDKENVEDDGPRVIIPDDFGMNEDYDNVTLLYHFDGYLTNEQNVLVDDIENTVGFECLNTFGEYEDDAVYVRNDKLKTDYEILKVASNYSDFIDDREEE